MLRLAVPRDHILSEAEPASSAADPATGPKYPDSEQFWLSAHHQDQSPLFKLPYEVREAIYRHLLRSAGLKRHVFVADGRYTHTRCITDDDGPDERQVEVERLMGESTEVENATWARRLLSSWNNHWRCEEAVLSDAQGISEPTPFLATLLTCKKM